MTSPPDKRPESVLVVVHTPALDILLLHRRQPFDFWQSVTGSLEAGERPAEAAVREIHEEIGLRIAPEALTALALRNRYRIPDRWRTRYADGVTHNTESVFALCLPLRMPLSPTSDEHDSARWHPPDEAVTRLWSWTNRDAVRLLVERLRAA